MRKALFVWAFLLAELFVVSPSHNVAAKAAAGPDSRTPIKHLIVVLQENHSFDNYFGTYPGGEGIPSGTCMPIDPDNSTASCIKPFHIGDNEVRSSDLSHSQATYADQYNNGAMNGFVAGLNSRNQDGRLAMGYYDERDVPFYWHLAQDYVLFDHFFSSASGGSFLNHVYWVSGSPGSGRDSLSTGAGATDFPTIFDVLEETGVSWKFYVQNYDPDLTYRTLRNYPSNRASQVTWVPLLNLDRFIDDPTLAGKIVDISQYYRDLQDGTLPSVAYVIPSGPSEHPPSSIRSGQIFTGSLLTALMRSDAWPETAFFISWDDWGGWYDHVQPPVVDRYGFGFRVPAILVSAYAKQGYIDHTVLDFTSFLKFISENWGTPPVSVRDATSNSMLSAFDFTQAPRRQTLLPLDRPKPLPNTRRSAVYAVYGSTFGLVLLGAITLWYVTHADKPRRYR